ncbi:hypothetical protein [Hydromonas duriensis]|uniref:Uncharacterized protein n=1 Tax=Hydromonas duriensis TaxID=1527608 RepID=A0A4R6Y3W6_9BURK|nr:hypothetical protein [Hydromonas duriensis]TDR27754.1 hypothetical protein DFR44_1403 [Hydromonas duriensis]
MNLKLILTKSAQGIVHSVTIEELDAYSKIGPFAEFKDFLEHFCDSINEKLIKWYLGVVEGIGEMTFEDGVIVVYWDDFPRGLNFDCPNKEVALKFLPKLQWYLKAGGWDLPFEDMS